ncbi:MAG: phosphotransferase [Candidatus Levybacteria bacterium]|nr:phosphotransferase [Candidatus Levybacteria bacterium]
MNPLESQPTGKDFQLPVDVRNLNIIGKRVFRDDQKVSEVVELKSGRFNTTYRMQAEDGETVVLRIAPDPLSEVYSHEQFLLRREHSVSASLTHVVDQAPTFLYVDFTGQAIRRDFAILNYLEGENWGEVTSRLSSVDNLRLWNQLVEISARINDVVGEGFGFPNPMPKSSSWSSALLNIQNGMIQDLDKYSLDSTAPKELAIVIRESESFLDSIEKPRLVHGDLWPKNILIKEGDDGFHISGVLDSERAFWGDPMAEWIVPGPQFAGAEAADGATFRCGLFSADYEGIPNSISERYLPKNFEEFIRSQIYLGIYLTQRRLESQRFPRSEEWIQKYFDDLLVSLKRA